MTASRTRRITAALLMAIGAAGCGSATGGGAQASAQPPIPRPSPSTIAQAKADSVRHPYTEADVQFMSGMIGHHAQAIVMANWAPTHGATPSVQRLAERIINAQQDEIATMQRWLGDRLKPVPEATPAGDRKSVV